MMTCIIDHCIDLIREQINGLQVFFTWLMVVQLLQNQNNHFIDKCLNTRQQLGHFYGEKNSFDRPKNVPSPWQKTLTLYSGVGKMQQSRAISALISVTCLVITCNLTNCHFFRIQVKLWETTVIPKDGIFCRIPDLFKAHICSDQWTEKKSSNKKMPWYVLDVGVIILVTWIMDQGLKLSYLQEKENIWQFQIWSKRGLFWVLNNRFKWQRPSAKDASFWGF